MLVHMTPDPYWPKLCGAIKRDDWAADDSYRTMGSRMPHGAHLAAGIQDAFKQHPMDYWSSRLDEFGLIWAPMTALPDVIRDESLRSVGAFETIEHPAGDFQTVGVPFSIEEADITARGPAPSAGEHTHEVLSSLGLPEERVAKLAADGVLG